MAGEPTPALCPPDPDDQGAVAAWRDQVHRAWLAGDPPAEACGHRQVTVAGIRCLRTAPGPEVVMVYCHGGGYALGSPEVALPITERLAPWVEVVSVDYRLAPEHPYPAGRDDCALVLDHVTRQARAGGRRVVAAGDSAGANLALGVALWQRDQGQPGPDGLVMLSPHLDLAADHSRGHHRLDDVDDVAAGWLRAAYCGSTPAGDPGLSPLRAELDGLPPTLIQVGSEDSARAQGRALAERAAAAGVEVTLDEWPGMWHTWHYHRDLPEADEALTAAGRFSAELAVVS